MDESVDILMNQLPHLTLPDLSVTSRASPCQVFESCLGFAFSGPWQCWCRCMTGRFGGWPLRWLAASASVAGCLCARLVLVLCLCCACARAVVCLCRSCVRLCRCAVGMSALAKAAVSFEAAAVVETAAFAAINSRIFDRHWGASSSGAARGGEPVLFFFVP